MNNDREEIEEPSAAEEPGVIETEPAVPDAEYEETVVVEKRAVPTRRLVLAGVAGIVLLSVTGFALWYFLLRSGDEGRPVPAPRGVDFGTQPSGGKLPAGERTVSLTEDQLRAADLKIATVGETLDAVALSETTTGVVRANEYERTPVVTQVGGVVRRLTMNLGQFVRRGQTVAVIASDELAAAQSKYLSMRAELGEAEKRYRRALELAEVSDESRTALDKATADLKAAEAKLAEARSQYERTRKLVDLGAKSRRELEQATTELRVAEANVREAQARFERARELLRIDPARRNELDQFLTRVRNMQADLAAARQRLLVLGLPAARVDALRSPSQISAELPVPSPISGTVTERTANLNEVVSMNGKLGAVTDLSTVWVIGQVYEKDLAKIRVGSGVSITSAAYPGEVFRGQVSYIDPNLETETRTAQVRIEIPNPGQKLKIGMYVDVAYAGLGVSERTAPLVPKEAVQTIGDLKVVFEATDDPRTFILRPVRLGPEKDNAYPVLEGIFVGDRIVTDGSFLLRAEYLKTNPEGL